jgi:hypothetical protein
MIYNQFRKQTINQINQILVIMNGGYICSGRVIIRCYVFYCTVLIICITHNAFIKPQHELIRKSLLNNLLESKLYTNVTICDRSVNVTFPFKHATFDGQNLNKERNVLVVIGHDKMNHVQTNNKLNALFHAIDYANDINADLALVRNGWPTKTLKILFNHDYQNDINSWEESIQHNLNVHFIDHDSSLVEIMKKNHFSDIYYNNSDDMYYYHTSASLEIIKQRRQPVLQYLWSHPTRKHGPGEMCAVVNNANAMGQSFDFPYSVVHSRWMKNNGCLGRMGGLKQRIKNETGISIDRKAPCLLEPSYIESILKKCGMFGKPIYVITDGLKPEIIQNLKADVRFGPDVRVVPKNISWVGGDMMLGVLSDCFIGTPISTLSGNVARARIALGKDPSTNFLFPLKKEKEDISEDSREFSCQRNADCLYDVRVLHHYVG